MSETHIAHEGGAHRCYVTETGVDRRYIGCSHDTPREAIEHADQSEGRAGTASAPASGVVSPTASDAGSIAIALTRGMVALIDPEDVDLVAVVTWYAHRSQSAWYARGWTADGVPHVRMHRLIVGAGPGQLVDHRNGDTLDNRRANLRIADASQQRANQPGRSVVGYKGVSLRDGTYQARIKVHGQQTSLGTYPTAELAGDAYERAALAVYGEFAYSERTALDAGSSPVPTSRSAAGGHRPLPAAVLDAGPDPVSAGRGSELVETLGP